MNKLFVLLLLVLYGCATTSKSPSEKEVMDSWLGSTKAELVLKWGPPVRIADDGQGGEIYVYEKQITFGQFPGSVKSTSTGLSYTNARSATVIRSRMFYINKEGKIYHWLCEGREK